MIPPAVTEMKMFVPEPALLLKTSNCIEELEFVITAHELSIPLNVTVAKPVPKAFLCKAEKREEGQKRQKKDNQTPREEKGRERYTKRR